MKKAFSTIGFVFFLSAVAAYGQTPTLVTGTITDPNGLPYSNARVSAQLIPSTASPTILVGGIPVQISGQQNASADVNGNFTMNLFCNNAAGGCSVISPSGTQWQITITTIGVLPPFGTGPQACSATLAISGASASISSNFSCPALTKVAGAGTGPGTGSPGAGIGGACPGPSFTNTVCAGPYPQSLGPALEAGSLVAQSNPSGPNVGPITATFPATNTSGTGDLAFFIVGAAPGTQIGLPTTPAGWTATNVSGNTVNMFRLQINTAGTVTASTTLTNSAAWSAVNFTLKGGAITPSFVQASLAITGSLTGLQFTTFNSQNTALNDGILVILSGQPNTGQFQSDATGQPSRQVSDSQGNTYTFLGQAVNSSSVATAVWFCNNISGATNDRVSVNITGTFSAAVLAAYEFSGILIATSSSPPTFRLLVPSDLPFNGGAPAVTSFSRTLLGSDVALTALTNTTLITKTIVMPQAGGPWRVLVTQATMYVTTAGSTLDSWVSDGTNVMASGQAWVSGTGNPGTTGVEFSPTTYTNNQSVTFTLLAVSGTTATAKASAGAGAGTGTYLDLAVMASN